LAGRLRRLTLYAEQMGFLQAPIDVKKQDGSVERTLPSRLEQYREAGRKAPLPDLPDGADYLVNAFFALRPTRPLAMGGIRAADWPEIAPFMQATKSISDAWEAETLHSMCSAFCDGFHAGQNSFGISPMERG